MVGDKGGWASTAILFVLFVLGVGVKDCFWGGGFVSMDAYFWGLVSGMAMGDGEGLYLGLDTC